MNCKMVILLRLSQKDDAISLYILYLFNNILVYFLNTCHIIKFVFGKKKENMENDIMFQNNLLKAIKIKDMQAPLIKFILRLLNHLLSY